jgi:hypothetical protein
MNYNFLFAPSWHQPEYVTFEPSSQPSTYTMVSLAQDRQWQKVQRQLVQYSLYQRDWDGFGSTPAHPFAFEAAAELLQKARANFSLPPSIATLSPSGAIQIEWWTGDNVLQAAISEPSKIDWVEFGPNEKPRHWNETINPSKISRGTTWGAASLSEEPGAASASAT